MLDIGQTLSDNQWKIFNGQFSIEKPGVLKELVYSRNAEKRLKGL